MRRSTEAVLNIGHKIHLYKCTHSMRTKKNLFAEDRREKSHTVTELLYTLLHAVLCTNSTIFLSHSSLYVIHLFVDSSLKVWRKLMKNALKRTMNKQQQKVRRTWSPYVKQLMNSVRDFHVIVMTLISFESEQNHETITNSNRIIHNKIITWMKCSCVVLSWFISN